MSTKSTIDLAHLRALLVKATPGPWRAGDAGGDHPDDIEALLYAASAAPYCDHAGTIGRKAVADAALIVAAVNALPALLDHVEALEAAGANGCIRCMAAMEAYEAERDQLAARVAKLEAALRRYGKHSLTCDLVMSHTAKAHRRPDAPEQPLPCTCGLDAALESP